MTVDIENQYPGELQGRDAAAGGRPHRERGGWVDAPQASRRRADDGAFAPTAPQPMIWPRVFPGL